MSDKIDFSPQAIREHFDALLDILGGEDYLMTRPGQGKLLSMIKFVQGADEGTLRVVGNKAILDGVLWVAFDSALRAAVEEVME